MSIVRLFMQIRVFANIGTNIFTNFSLKEMKFRLKIVLPIARCTEGYTLNILRIN